MGKLQALRLLMAVSVVLTVLPVPGASAQVSDSLPWTYIVEDAELDEADQCVVVWDTSTDGGCDIIRFAALNDETTFQFQFKTGTMAFPNPAFAVFLRLVVTAPDASVMIAQVRIDSAGFAPGGVTCTPEGPSVPNLTWSLDRAADAVVGSFPLASLPGAVPGATIGITAVASRLAVGAANNYVVTCGAADSIPTADLLPYVVTGLVVGGASDLPTYIDVATPEFSVEDTKDNFTGSSVYNWTSNLTAASLDYVVENATGEVTLTVVDGSNASVASELLNGSASLPLDTVTPGNWTVRLDYANFTGSLQISISAPLAVPDVVPDTNVTDNTTASLSSTKEKGSPGLALPVLLTMLAAVVAITRRK